MSVNNSYSNITGPFSVVILLWLLAVIIDLLISVDDDDDDDDDIGRRAGGWKSGWKMQISRDMINGNVWLSTKQFAKKSYNFSPGIGKLKFMLGSQRKTHF